ncbi:hypothetical protein ABTF50_19930, partial [Acinetobacter baumannii]
MMSQAISLSASNHASYRAAMMSFAAASALSNNSFQTLKPLTTDLSSVRSAAANAPISLYYTNGCPTNSYCNNDTDTASSDAFTKMNIL